MKKYFLYVAVLMAIIITAFAYTANIQLTGRVVDEAGAPISGASINIKGTRTGTVTDSAGTFTINVPNEKAVLEIKYIGYNAQEVTVGNNTSLIIKLISSKQNLSEVVVIGYGKRLKRDLAGAVQGITTQNYSAPSIVRDEEARTYAYADQWTDDKRTNADYSREGYDRIVENRFLKTSGNPLSTFSIDVDAASYSNIRRMINYNQLPPAGAVRIEEMINYFSYQYPQPTGADPFSINTEIAACPWNPEHRLVSIGLQGKTVPVTDLPACNLTFLIDVSGSMDSEDKLPLVKASLKLLIDQLREQDKVAIVVYAGSAGLVLPSTSGSNKIKIREAIQSLEAGGSTAGGQGIQLAYKTAQSNFRQNGNNRVILCTDGDFNVGLSSDDALERLIEEKRNTGIFLTVLGYGTGNYQDAKMQKLADKGNGNHAYIDNQSEAKKVLVSEFGGTLFTIAKDVKLQVEFNPAKVQGYRLIGYENRMLAKEDFNNDKKDAGELGSGHTVTALYEVIPVGIKSNELDKVDDLKYQKPLKQKVPGNFSGELMNIKLRYKQPDGEVSKLLQHPVMDDTRPIKQASDNLRFAAAVAQFGMLLRNSAYKGNGSFAMVNLLANGAITSDGEGYRKEFIELVKKAQALSEKDMAGKLRDDK